MHSEDQIEYWAKREILLKITELLERKHLYQSVSLDREIINQKMLEIEQKKFAANEEQEDWEIINQSHPIDGLEARKAEWRDQMNRIIAYLLTNAWGMEVETCVNPSDAITRRESARERNSWQLMVLPLIKITCNHCQSILPAHISGCIETWAEVPTYNPQGEAPSETFLQIFSFPYQCQSCRGEPIVFIVRREGLKLTLVGRSQFEKVTAPDSIPKPERRFYSEAIIAINAGRVLAGLFFLRTILEQYMRRVLKLSTTERRTGDELGDAYAKLLDDEFPKKYKTLKTIYADLSEDIHAAAGDQSLFADSAKHIQKHFDLLQHMPLKPNG